jgi:hypothetical protein
MGGGGIPGFILVLASAAAPFVVVLLLVRFVGRPKSVVAAVFLSVPPALTVAVFLLYCFHDAMVVHPDAQGALIYIFAPIYSVPYAIGAWLAAFLVLLLVRAMAWRPGPQS